MAVAIALGCPPASLRVSNFSLAVFIARVKITKKSVVGTNGVLGFLMEFYGLSPCLHGEYWSEKDFTESVKIEKWSGENFRDNGGISVTPSFGPSSCCARLCEQVAC